ncbi:MAG TPA: FAD-dependent oxidoreductase [Candidatus Babeliales bacterium]|nr:FAD-dependent oxidoreductase [Candidatus Babeliales bacterium]
MANVVILGAGLTGLSAAYHLEKNGFYDYTLFEKEETVGGLCRSIEQDGFTFDLTGHLLHASDNYVRSLIDNLIGLQHFNYITRQAYIYSQGRYTHYPYQINLFGLPTKIIAECIEGFVTRNPTLKENPSFYDWVLHEFGAGFGNHFFFPYQTKMLAHDIHNLTASWTSRYVPKTSLKQIIDGALTENNGSDVGYNAHFFYPKYGGTFFWVNRFAKHIKNPIKTNFCVQSIDIQHKKILFANGHIESYNQLINTIPLDTLLHALREPSSSTLKSSAHKLLCNSVVNFNIGVNNSSLGDKHWIYYPEHQYPFYRIGFPHNFSSELVPAGCNALAGEFSYINQPSATIDETLKMAIKQVKTLFNIADQDIKTEKIIYISHGYVIYDFWREQYLPVLLKTLQKQSIYCAGRYAEWKYSSMQDALLDGQKIAHTITALPARTALCTPRIKISERKREL